ncbi:MAG TPA: DUF6798 domain-containing protein [Candidatus Polarisedimenticolia bacterium]|nr:DUF6798 domain-containing protein [Candidatus Polarisedimenticolia bacterium]
MKASLGSAAGRTTASGDGVSAPAGRTVARWALLLSFLSIPITGMGIQWNNQSLQVPLIHWINDRSLYPGDPFAATLKDYASLLWWGVAALARLIPVEPLLVIGFLVQRFLLLLGVGRVAAALAPACRAAPVAAMAILGLGADIQRPGAGTLVSAYFEQTGLAVAFILLSAASVIETRRWPAALWLAAAWTSNPLYGAFGCTYLAPLVFLAGKGSLRRWLPASALFLALSLPSILFSAGLLAGGSGTGEPWLETGRVWLHYHLFPLTWARPACLRFALTMALVTLAAASFRRRIEERSFFWMATLWSAVATAWLAAAFVAGHVLRDPAPLMLQPGRATDLWYPLGAALFAAVMARQSEEESSMEGRALAATALIAGISLWQRLFASFTVAAVVVVLALPHVRRWIVERRSRLPMLLSGIMVLVACRVVAPGLARGDLAGRVLLRPPASELAAARWAQDNTEPQATFLVPSEWDSFRALSRRPVFLTWKDVSAILWQPSYVTAWRERLAAAGAVIRPDWRIHEARAELSRVFDDLRDEDVMRLSRRFGVDYWVVPEDHVSSLEESARQAGMKILKVAAGAGTP